MNTAVQLTTDNVVWYVFQYDPIIPLGRRYAPDIKVMDVTTVNPIPEEGWIYNPMDMTFSPPPVPPAPTSAELIMRLKVAESKYRQDHGLDDLKTFLDWYSRKANLSDEQKGLIDTADAYGEAICSQVIIWSAAFEAGQTWDQIQPNLDNFNNLNPGIYITLDENMNPILAQG